MIEVDVSELVKQIEETEDAMKQLLVDLAKPGQQGRGISKSFKQRGLERELLDIINTIAVNNYDKAVNAVKTSPGPGWKVGSIPWPEMKRRLIDVPAGQPTRNFLNAFGFNTDAMERKDAGAKVLYDENWKATGHTELRTKLSEPYTNYTDDMIELGRIADYVGETYPADIDRRMMQTTGGNVGLMKFFVGDKKKLFEKLEGQFITITEALFLNRLKDPRRTK